MNKTRVFLNRECVKKLKKEGSERVALPSGDEIEFVWTDAKDAPKPTVEASLQRQYKGSGAFVEVVERLRQ